MNAKLREFLDIFGYIFCSFKCGINLSSSCIRLSKRSSVSATSIEDNLSLGNSFIGMGMIGMGLSTIEKFEIDWRCISITMVVKYVLWPLFTFDQKDG